MYELELAALKSLYEKGLFDPKFYSDKVTGAECFNDYESFKKIPFTHKQELRDTPILERTSTKSGEVYGVFSSSGTTGNKTFYVYNKNDKAVHEEFVKEFYTELGINEHDIGGVFAPVDTGVMAHTMMWQFTTMGASYVNCPDPSPVNMADVITAVPVTVVATRPTVASLMAYDKQAAAAAKKSMVSKLLMGGGFLSGERRKLLEETWDAECFNMFGMSEMFGPMAGECRQKHGQHYLSKYLMIEIVDPVTGEPVAEGESGVAVYTTLWEKGFPLLRYWTNDVMYLTYEKCACGSSNPRLFYRGRLNDMIKAGGRLVFPMQVESILFKHGFIGEYKVVKDGDEITVYTERNGKVLPSQMVSELDHLFDTKISLSIVAPNSLGLNVHGKRFEIVGNEDN